MSLKIDTKSSSAVLRIKNIDKLTKSGIEYAAYMSAKSMRDSTSQEILKGVKTGRVYIRRDKLGRRRRHVASAPGETHANLTGKTRRSLGWKVNPTQIEFGYGVDRNDAPPYAARLEFGDQAGPFKARPSLQNGIKSQRRNYQTNFEREIGKRLEGFGGLS